MRLFFNLLLLIGLIICQVDKNFKDEFESYKLEFEDCIAKHGINGIIKNMENKIKKDDSGIENILNSFRKKMEKKEEQDIIKECRKKILEKISKNKKKD